MFPVFTFYSLLWFSELEVPLNSWILNGFRGEKMPDVLRTCILSQDRTAFSRLLNPVFDQRQL